MRQQRDITDLLYMLSPDAYSDLLTNWCRQIVDAEGAEPVKVYGNDQAVERAFARHVLREMLVHFGASAGLDLASEERIARVA